MELEKSFVESLITFEVFPTKPIVKRYSDFENTLASILYNREYTGPTKTEEEDIEKPFGGYLELTKKLALDLMAKAHCEIMIEVLNRSLEQETAAESWNKRLNSDE